MAGPRKSLIDISGAKLISGRFFFWPWKLPWIFLWWGLLPLPHRPNRDPCGLRTFQRLHLLRCVGEGGAGAGSGFAAAGLPGTPAWVEGRASTFLHVGH